MNRPDGRVSLNRAAYLWALAVFGCGLTSTPEDTSVPDVDGDGYSFDDCNDDNAGIHPEADELCNEVDDDCDGVVDDQVVDADFCPPLSDVGDAHFRFDLGRSGVATGKAPDGGGTGAIRWTSASVVDDFFSVPPVAVPGVVFAASTRTVYALDSADGSVIWTGSSYQGSSEGGLAVSGGIVYLADDSGEVVALRADNGTLLWEETVGNDPVGPPLVVDGIVLTGSYNAMALDAQTGAVIWESGTDPSEYGSYGRESVGGAPAFSEGIVYFVIDGNECHSASCDSQDYTRLIALDATDGSLQWSTRWETQGGSSPTISGDTLFILPGDGTLQAIDKSNGTEEWATEVDVSWTWVAEASPSSPAVSKDAVFVSGREVITAVSATNGRELWTVEAQDALTASIAKGVLYVPSSTGIDGACLSALGAEDGDTLWASAVCSEGGGYGSPFIEDGLIFTTTSDGHLVALE